MNKEQKLKKYLERLERTRHRDLPDSAEWEATALASRQAVESWETAAERDESLWDDSTIEDSAVDIWSVDVPLHQLTAVSPPPGAETRASLGADASSVRRFKYADGALAQLDWCLPYLRVFVFPSEKRVRIALQIADGAHGHGSVHVTVERPDTTAKTVRLTLDAESPTQQTLIPDYEADEESRWSLQVEVIP